ncbi:MAG: phospholipid carrier-dependent glycosyltransferase, partial [Anaerolineales bacterium]|nr:phospholipid carrier-dependent glycosyltransferase [Anaerolineales bacterium]
MSSRNSLPQARLSLVLVLAAFLILGIIYSSSVPIFEKPDELFHYFFVQHLLDERSLPVMGGPGEHLWEQEGSQPPLYYTLAALVTSWVDTSDARELLWLNPQRNLGDPENPGNKNFTVHTDRETRPYRGTTLAVHIARWLSLLFGAGTVILIYVIVQQVFPARPLLALSAAAINAFIPQFLFISSSVSNDSLITFLAALTLLQLIRIAAGTLARKKGNEPYRCGWRACSALGITIGLAALTKLSGLALLGLSGLIFCWIAWRRRSWRILLTDGLIVGGVTAVIAGWWFVRNLQLYGSLDGIDLHLQAMGGRRELALTAESAWRELIGLRASFWGLFGWFGILMPEWVYQVIDLLTLVGVIGLARRRNGRNWGQGTAITLLWLALVLISLLRWTTMVEGSQGRLLFPALPGIALLLALGWSNVLPARWKSWRYAFPLGVAGGLFVLSAVVPSRIIAPAYARPQLL